MRALHGSPGRLCSASVSRYPKRCVRRSLCSERGDRSGRSSSRWSPRGCNNVLPSSSSSRRSGRRRLLCGPAHRACFRSRRPVQVTPSLASSIPRSVLYLHALWASCQRSFVFAEGRGLCCAVVFTLSDPREPQSVGKRWLPCWLAQLTDGISDVSFRLRRLLAACTHSRKAEVYVLYLKAWRQRWDRQRLQRAGLQALHHAAVPTLKVRMVAKFSLGTAYLKASPSLSGFHCACKLRIRQRIQDAIHRHCINSLRRDRIDQIHRTQWCVRGHQLT